MKTEEYWDQFVVLSETETAVEAPGAQQEGEDDGGHRGDVSGLGGDGEGRDDGGEEAAGGGNEGAGRGGLVRPD